MSNVLVDRQKIDILANAISEKSGEPVTMTLNEMVEAVDGIEVGGGGITPTGNINITQAGVTDVTNYATATVPYAEMGLTTMRGYTTLQGQRQYYVTPNCSVTSDGWVDSECEPSPVQTTYFTAIPTGTTVTPTTSAQTIGGANYMMEGAVTVNAMPSGTAGTPTATKGTVSNHSVSVTPSVTNTTGYITGSTKTGTAVTVSASELVSGSETKTENGTYDVTNLASLVVNVSSGVDIPVFRATWTPNGTLSGTITCNKTYNQCFSLVQSDYMYAGVIINSFTYPADPSTYPLFGWDDYIDGQSCILYRNDGNYSQSIKYASDGTLSVIDLTNL